MKKIIFGILLMLLGPIHLCFADTTDSTLYLNLGAVKFYLPLASGANAAYLWDFNNKKSLVGAETPIVTYRNFTLTGGGVTTLDGQGAPFGRLYYTLPANSFSDILNAINMFHVGLWGGRDFTVGGQKAWLFGISASKQIW